MQILSEEERDTRKDRPDMRKSSHSLSSYRLGVSRQRRERETNRHDSTVTSFEMQIIGSENGWTAMSVGMSFLVEVFGSKEGAESHLGFDHRFDGHLLKQRGGGASKHPQPGKIHWRTCLLENFRGRKEEQSRYIVAVRKF